MNEARRNPSAEKKEKSVALPAEDTSSDDDEEIALLSRKVAKLIRSKRRVGNTSKVCFECRKPGHFKEDCPRLKKKYEDKDSEEKEKLKKKSAWKDDKKKKKKKKKALKATWSDSSDDEKNEDIEDEEVNLCLMANSSEGEYDISDTSPEELQEALEEVFMKLKNTRKELKKVKNENLQQLAKISCLTEELEITDNTPKESVEALQRIRELELENTTLKEEVERLRLVTSTEPCIAEAHNEFIHLRELYEKLLGSQKAFDMLLGSQRPSLRKEGLGYDPIKVKAKRVEKEKYDEESRKLILKNEELRSRKMARKYEIDDKARIDRRYRYSHSFGLLGQCRVVDILGDSTHCDNERKLDPRTSTTNVTSHTRNMQHRSSSHAPSTFHIPLTPLYPSIGHLRYPMPTMVPDRRLDPGMNMSPYPYSPYGYHGYFPVPNVGPMWGSPSWY